MSYTSDVATRPSTDDQGALMHGHPRGRGFSILSRLAREQQAPTVTAAPPVEPVEPVEAVQLVDVVEPVEPAEPAEAAEAVDLVEPVAQVLIFDRPQPAPRHRRDDVDTEPTRRSS